MDDALGPRTLLPVSVDMGHDVVAHQLLPLLCHIVVNVIRKSLQLINLFLCNIQSQFSLRLRQGDPQLSPGLKLLVR